MKNIVLAVLSGALIGSILLIAVVLTASTQPREYIIEHKVWELSCQIDGKPVKSRAGADTLIVEDLKINGDSVTFNYPWIGQEGIIKGAKCIANQQSIRVERRPINEN